MPRTSAQDLQEEFLTTMHKGQENVLDALKAWVETVRTVTPKLPIVNVPFADKLPTVAVPFADRLPSPREAVGNTYRLAEQLLDNQRKFAEDVLKVTEPLIPGQRRRHGDPDRAEARRSCARACPEGSRRARPQGRSNPCAAGSRRARPQRRKSLPLPRCRL